MVLKKHHKQRREAEKVKSINLRLYDDEAEALARLAMVKDKSQNEIINNLIARAYCEVDTLAERHPITSRLYIAGEDFYFFEGMLAKLLNITDNEPMTEYRREDLELIAAKDRRKIPELYRAATYSINKAKEYFKEHESFLNEHQERCEQITTLIQMLNGAITDLEEIYKDITDNEGY